MKVSEVYGKKIRLRVCGVLNRGGEFLLVKHEGLNPSNEFWNFPGGGLEENEDIKSALAREFKEETRLEISIGELVHIQEFIQGELHAIELYFQVYQQGKEAAKLGFDPEMNILTGLRWFKPDEVKLIPEDQKPSYLKKILEKFATF